MREEDESNIVIFDHNVDDIAPTVALKIAGLDSNHVQELSRFFPIEFFLDSQTNTWEFKIKDREFGTHKIQTVRLLALALLVHEHFPQASMGLTGSPEMDPASPLKISESIQIYLQHAGFDIKPEKGDRVLSLAEMTQFKEQFLHLHNKQLPKRGAS